MTERADYQSLAPEALKILMDQELYLSDQFLQSDVFTIRAWELIKLRVSQMNQCAYCIDMHTQEALHKGEDSARIIALSAWHESPRFSDTERLALNWAERLTQCQPIEDAAYQAAVATLGEQLLMHLTIAVNAINSWNRIAKVFKPEVGSYRVQSL